MKKKTLIFTIFLMLLFVFMSGCSESTTEDGSGSGVEPTDEPTESSSSNEEISSSDWAEVKAWEGTVTVTRSDENKNTLNLSDEVVKEIEKSLEGTLSGNVRYEFNSEWSDETFLIWEANFDVNYTHNYESISTAYVNGAVDTVEKATETGSGTAPVIPAMDANFLEISLEDEMFGFEVNPTFEVERHEIIEVNGVVGHDETFMTDPVDHVFITVSESLPESGMHLTGTYTMMNGSVVEYDLHPAE